MLSGSGMQKSLQHRGYKPSPNDSLSVEMSRQHSLITGLQTNGPPKKQVAAGVLSGMHFTEDSGQFSRHQGIKTVRTHVGRDPILAKGQLEVVHGYDAVNKPRKHKPLNHRVERRNIITGEGKMETHGFDAYRRPMFAAGHLRRRSTLNIYGSQ